MAYWVTSEPVPAVVGTATMGKAFALASHRASVPLPGAAAITEMALLASMGEPPPMPIKNSTPSVMAIFAARSTVSTSGFSPISSNSTHWIPRLSRASAMSFWAPFFLAELLPVTTMAFLPSFAMAFLFASTQPLPK